MARFKQCTLLELAALLALIATVAAITVVVTGVLRDGRPEAAARLTALCRPVANAMTHDDPTQISRRDILLLRQETVQLRDAMAELIKDTDGDVRSRLRLIREQLMLASDDFGVLPIAQRARVLEDVARRAAELGASCPSPLSSADGDALQRRLEPR